MKKVGIFTMSWKKYIGNSSNKRQICIFSSQHTWKEKHNYTIIGADYQVMISQVLANCQTAQSTENENVF